MLIDGELFTVKQRSLKALRRVSGAVCYEWIRKDSGGPLQRKRAQLGDALNGIEHTKSEQARTLFESLWKDSTLLQGVQRNCYKAFTC